MNLQEKHYVGVDCHKDTIACYINGKFKEFRTDFKGFSKAQFASYCGVAPVECSSGLSTRFRNNKRGNRTLNSLLYSISIFQSRFDTEGSKYFQKKISEGKSKKLARKHLARQVSNQIWKILFAA